AALQLGCAPLKASAFTFSRLLLPPSSFRLSRRGGYMAYVPGKGFVQTVLELIGRLIAEQAGSFVDRTFGVANIPFAKWPVNRNAPRQMRIHWQQSRS